MKLRNPCRWVGTAGLALVLWPGCASPETAGGSGSACYRIEDCQEGLVCVKNACSNKLDEIAGEVPPMPGAGGAMMVVADSGAGGMGAAGAAGAVAAGGRVAGAGGRAAAGGGSAAGGKVGAGGTASAAGGKPGAGGAAPSSGGAPASSGGAQGSGGAESSGGAQGSGGFTPDAST